MLTEISQIPASRGWIFDRAEAIAPTSLKRAIRPSKSPRN
jgi:hypothetical protein